MKNGYGDVRVLALGKRLLSVHWNTNTLFNYFWSPSSRRTLTLLDQEHEWLELHLFHLQTPVTQGPHPTKLSERKAKGYCPLVVCNYESSRTAIQKTLGHLKDTVVWGCYRLKGMFWKSVLMRFSCWSNPIKRNHGTCNLGWNSFQEIYSLVGCLQSSSVWCLHRKEMLSHAFHPLTYTQKWEWKSKIAPMGQGSLLPVQRWNA